MGEFYEYDVVINGDICLTSYYQILSRFNNWKTTLRDLKLSLILNEGKKLALDIDQITTTHKFGTMWGKTGPNVMFDANLKDVSFVIDSLSFTITSDLIVDNLKVSIKTLSSKQGQILKEEIENGVELRIYQNFNNHDFKSFYIDL